MSRPNSRAFSHSSSPWSAETILRDPVPLQRRALHPEQGDLRLLVRALAGRGDVVATEALHLSVVGGVRARGHLVRRVGAELRAVAQHERGDVPPTRGERERGAGREPVLAGLVALRVRRVHQEGVRTVVGPEREDRSGGRRSHSYTPPLLPAVRDRVERGLVVGLDAGDPRIDACLRDRRGRELAEDRDQDVVRGRRDGRIDGCPSPRVSEEGVLLVAPVDRVQGVVDGHVRHRVHARFQQGVAGGGEAGGESRVARVRAPC